MTASCCSPLFAISQDDWQTLSDGRSIECPKCGERLYFRPRPELKIATSVRVVPVLRAFSDSDYEQQFISAASSPDDPASETALAVFHQTTYERLALAMKCLEGFRVSALETSAGFYNNNELSHPDLTKDHADETAISNWIYQFAVSLFSAVESLAQEINIALRVGLKERDAGYKALRGRLLERIGAPTEALAFINGDDFNYLKGLRNLCQHRRIATQAIIIERSLAEHPPIVPRRLSKSIRYLPDDPEAHWGKERFDEKLEVRETVSRLFERSAEFIDLCYAAAARAIDEERPP